MTYGNHPSGVSIPRSRDELGRPSHEGYRFRGNRPTVFEVAGIHIVVLDPRFAPRDQIACAFTNDDDAQAVAGFLNTRLGAGETVHGSRPCGSSGN